MEPLIYRPLEAAKLLGISRSAMYLLLTPPLRGEAQVPSFKLGSARMITATALRKFVADRSGEAQAQAASQ